MDLAAGAKRLWVVMEHTTRDNKHRLVRRCACPLTAPGAVARIYTNLAIIDVTADGFLVIDMLPGLSREALQAASGAPLRWP
jgi:3-oxoadipate CoA-transferase beta subunit